MDGANFLAPNSIRIRRRSLRHGKSKPNLRTPRDRLRHNNKTTCARLPITGVALVNHTGLFRWTAASTTSDTEENQFQMTGTWLKFGPETRQVSCHWHLSHLTPTAAPPRANLTIVKPIGPNKPCTCNLFQGARGERRKDDALRH